jgi:UDP-3-O-[3-hydroxymyristoyl] glucosamine N-acyltransferase
MRNATITVSKIATFAGLSATEDARAFSRLSSYEEADAEAIVFAHDDAALARALASGAGLILAPLSGGEEDARMLCVKDPKHVFALCGRFLDSFVAAEIDPDARVSPQATLGAGCSVGAGAVIEAGAVLGANCVVASNATIYACARLGNGVLVQAGAVLGAMGFGYVRGADGTYVRFPQQGTLVVEDHVEIGANTTIDRGALGETRIGMGTKIDNLVHIGHNCTIGKNVVIAAQVGISGSCTIGDGAILAGQVGISDHCTIGAGVILGGQAGVFRGATVEGPGQMFAGTPAEPIKDYLKSMARLRRLK